MSAQLEKEKCRRSSPLSTLSLPPCHLFIETRDSHYRTEHLWIGSVIKFHLYFRKKQSSFSQHTCIHNIVDLALKPEKEEGGKKKDDRASSVVALLLNYINKFDDDKYTLSWNIFEILWTGSDVQNLKSST